MSNVAVFVPTGIAAIVSLRHDGAAETLASYDSIAALGGTQLVTGQSGMGTTAVRHDRLRDRHGLSSA